MALRPVGIIQPEAEVKERKAKQGGGKLGQALGAAAGGVIGGIAGFVGGGGPIGAAQGALMGTSAGAGVGGMLGEAISPSRAGETAIQRRMEVSGPQMMQSKASAQLKESIAALRTQPPQIQQEYAKPLTLAYMSAVAKEYA